MPLRVYPSSVAPFVLILPRIHADYCALNSFVKAGLPILIVIMMKSVNSGKWSRPKSGFQVIITIALLVLFNSSLVLIFPVTTPFFSCCHFFSVRLLLISFLYPRSYSFYFP